MHQLLTFRFFYNPTPAIIYGVYFAGGSTVNIAGTYGYPVFYLQSNYDFYPGLRVCLSKVNDYEGVQDSYGVNQVYRIDSGAEFILENNNGTAFYDQGNAVSILANPGSTVRFIGNHTSGVVYFAHASSKLVLNEPEYYDLRNNAASGPAFYAATTTNPALQIKNSDLGAWAIGANLSGPPTVPSPFAKINLNSGNTSPLAGSSAILGTMPGGWGTNKYSRLALVTPPSVSASDKTLGVNNTVSIHPTYQPSGASLSYQSGNPAIATVNASGVITGVSAGTTTMTITVTDSLGVTASATINVTVTDYKPVLTVPAFTEISVGDDFDPWEGVSASDLENGDLSDLISVLGSVDVHQAGLYRLEYRVVDSDGNEASARRLVLVNDGNYVVDGDYIIHAKDFTIKESKVVVSDAALMQAADVRVYHRLSGFELVDPVLEVDQGGYTSKAGVYDVSFTYNPTITIQATVLGEDGSALPDTGVSERSAYLSLAVLGLGVSLVGLGKRRRDKKSS